MMLEFSEKTIADLKDGTITALQLNSKVSKQYIATVKITKFFTVDNWLYEGQNFFITADT